MDSRVYSTTTDPIFALIPNVDLHILDLTSVDLTSVGLTSVGLTSITRIVRWTDLTRITWSKSRISKPNPKYAMFVSAMPVQTPQQASNALRILEWYDALRLEFEALKSNQTWELVIDKMPSDNIIDSLWVFKVKHHQDGIVERLKAHLVIDGARQIKGVDYHDTFSSVIKVVSILLVMMVAITWGGKLAQMNNRNAFLNGLLDERIIMQQPLGFVDTQYPHHVLSIVQGHI